MINVLISLLPLMHVPIPQVRTELSSVLQQMTLFAAARPPLALTCHKMLTICPKPIYCSSLGSLSSVDCCVSSLKNTTETVSTMCEISALIVLRSKKQRLGMLFAVVNRSAHEWLVLDSLSLCDRLVLEYRIGSARMIVRECLE